MSTYETIQVILSIGTFTIGLITWIVKLLKNDNKNNRS